MEEKARIIQLPKILDERGNLSFIEQNNHIPFVVCLFLQLYFDSLKLWEPEVQQCKIKLN